MDVIVATSVKVPLDAIERAIYELVLETHFPQSPRCRWLTRRAQRCSFVLRQPSLNETDHIHIRDCLRRPGLVTTAA